MGRIRIKKKDRVLPFRSTVAYRFIIVLVAFLLFLIAAYQVISALGQGDTTALIVAGLAATAALVLGLYNLTQMQHAKVPRQTLQRMKRR